MTKQQSMNKWIFAGMFLTLIASATGCRSDQTNQNSSDRVSLADFFAYSCMQAYTRKHALPKFDSSVAYAVENSIGSADDFTRLYEQAEAFAAQMPAPDLSDTEHGGVAVMARCLEESRRMNNRTIAEP